MSRAKNSAEDKKGGPLATEHTRDQPEILKEFAEIELHIFDEDEFAALILGPDDIARLFGAPDVMG